jgi:serine/threonine protein kinase/tetratricopeptide (TPR) repeat protein
MSDQNQEDRTRTSTLLSRGTAVSHYKILGRIGAGGMGEVYLAQDTKLDREVALKFIPQHVANDKARRERFIREAKAAAKLHHPHIVTIYDVDDSFERPFYVMEHVEGKTLGDLIDRGNVSSNSAIEYIAQIADALVEVHDAGIIHRDIKPANIVIDNNGRARLLDFGLARVSTDERLTREGTTVGTVAYMSPEQVENSNVDHRTDIYSLGMTLYQLLTGKLPHRKDNDAATVHAIVNDELPPVNEFNHEISDEIANAISMMTAKNPNDRFENAKELKKVLESSVSGVSFETRSTDVSIAVLPFSNMSADAEQEYFCDGIAEDIINDLTQVPGLRVVARTSAFAFKNKHDDVRRIGQRLNVAHVLEGSVRKSGERVRVTAQLIKVADGFHLWSDKYDRKLDDIFAIQDEISRTIVDTLKLKLSGKETVKSTEVVPIEAYQLYSKGRYNLNLRTPAGFREALKCFEQAIELYPEYALAYAGMADTFFLLFAYDLEEPRDAIAKARSAAHKSIQLNPKQAEAYTTLGGILSYYDWDWKEAEAAFQKALEFGPGYAMAHQWYGEILSHLNRNKEAELHMNQALQNNPLSDIIYTMIGCHYLKENQFQKADGYFKRAIEMGTNNEITFSWSAFASLEMGDTEAAIKMFDEGCRRTNDGPYSITMKAHGLALMGKLDETRELLKSLEEKRKERYVPEAYLATLYFDIGDEEQGIRWLEDAIRRHNTELIFMAIMPYYSRNISKNERAKFLMSIIGL